MALTSIQIAVLRILANGIIPADGRDQGAASVNAADRIAEKYKNGSIEAIYTQGVQQAQTISRSQFGRDVADLAAAEVNQLLSRIRDESGAFFKQLRMDVCAFYLGDEDVQRRIGFPGPSSESGGYPDFDQPQIQ